MNKFILIIDDNEAIRDALSWSLSEKGYTSITAAHGQEAWDIMEQKGVPVLILLDMMMPIMDGYEFRIKKHNHVLFKNIPTIILSAKPNLEIQLHLNEVFLPKPFDLHFLFKIIKNKLSSLLNKENPQLAELCAY
jgi:CheY-like chemotaxis protein